MPFAISPIPLSAFLRALTNLLVKVPTTANGSTKFLAKLVPNTPIPAFNTLNLPANPAVSFPPLVTSLATFFISFWASSNPNLPAKPPRPILSKTFPIPFIAAPPRPKASFIFNS